MKRRPKVLGLTGGIGSGKTFIAQIFQRIGYPVYNSDTAAKNITNNNPQVLDAIRQEFGDFVFQESQLDRKKLAEVVFGDSEKLKRLNHIIHPKVGEDFKNWSQMQSSAWVIKEAAILFESGAYLQCDKTLHIAAPADVRISRVVLRDKVSAEEVQRRINAQWTDAERAELADYSITNDGIRALLPQINEVISVLDATKD